MKKKIIFILSVLAFMFILAGCKTAKIFNISIIATSDVHCGIEDNITYAGIKEYRNERTNSGYQTTLVDCGDFIQGASIGLLSKGKDINAEPKRIRFGRSLDEIMEEATKVFGSERPICSLFSLRSYYAGSTCTTVSMPSATRKRTSRPAKGMP